MSLNLLTNRAFVCVVGVIPRIDVESVSFVWNLPLDVSLVDEILPQLARTVATIVSTLDFSRAYRRYFQSPCLKSTYLFAPGTRHAMPHITVCRSISAVWSSLNSARYAAGPSSDVERAKMLRDPAPGVDVHF